MKLLVVVERTKTGYSAYSPDLPGCVATGASPAEVEAGMEQAVGFHLEGLTDRGAEPPSPSTYATFVEIGPS